MSIKDKKRLIGFWKENAWLKNLVSLTTRTEPEQSGPHLIEYGARRLVNIFCNNLIKCRDVICLDRNTIEKSVKTKKANDNLKVSMNTADKPIVSCPETQNYLTPIMVGFLGVCFVMREGVKLR